ncbi:hypothetical protein NCC78_00040 [Micromonospora phytophila]|uniref:hypothetical protein n=1 Tax=Micromonospora phytophila TaxID=709888 RepID=UPI00202EA659|nr:hypothetical protein [Micromonospora phytophila]MCM0673130.1 hypothetical protein [Micromonospora phytophila]
MGSDWTCKLQVPAAAEPALRKLYALAADRDLGTQRPDGLINLFTNPDGDSRTVEDPQASRRHGDGQGAWPALDEWRRRCLRGLAGWDAHVGVGRRVELLDDPVAVDPLGYQDIHTCWLRAA